MPKGVTLLLEDVEPVLVLAELYARRGDVSVDASRALLTVRAEVDAVKAQGN